MLKNNPSKYNSIAIYKPNRRNTNILLHICKQISSDVTIIRKPDNYLDNKSINLLWGKLKHRELIRQNPNAKIWSAEDGFIRSNGLGRHFYIPNSICIDSKGVYYDTNNPSDLEDYLNSYSLSLNDIKTSKEIIKLITSLNINKYNINIKNNIKLSKSKINKKIILIIGQVEDDESIKLGSSFVKTNLDLIKLVREKNKNAYIIYKPHPDVLHSNRIGKVKDGLALKYVDHVEKKASITNCIKFSDEVHTITSLAGMESLIYKKRVITWGRPFYGGWGLTVDMQSYTRRNRKLSLEELVFIVYELYPFYWDYKKNSNSSAIDIIKLLYNQKQYGNFYFAIRKFISKLIKKSRKIILKIHP